MPRTASVPGSTLILDRPFVNAADEASEAAKNRERAQEIYRQSHPLCWCHACEPGGVYLAGRGIEDWPERLMRNADMALYRAKAAGRRSGAFYRPEMDRALQASRSLEAGLRRALADGGLSLVYQPVFDVRDRRVRAVEALVRWRHPGGARCRPPRSSRSPKPRG